MAVAVADALSMCHLHEILNIVGVWLLIEGLLLIHHHICVSILKFNYEN